MSPPSTHVRVPILVLAVLLAGAVVTRAQELREQPTPFSAWVDFQTLGSPNAVRQPLPIWLESVRKTAPSSATIAPLTTTVRIRLRRFGSLNSQLQLRVFFTDLVEALPVVTAWSETGALQYRSEPLGVGLGLATSETLVVPTANVDYIDVTVVGDGTNLRGAFLATLKKAATLHALDFSEPPELEDAFAKTRKATPDDQDRLLYGRVKATLQAEAAALLQTGELTWSFELDANPLLGMISMEILGADPAAPIQVTVNDRPLGAVALQLPDLADPAYQAIVRPMESTPRFQYGGWLRAQQAIPGAVLRAGLNKIVLRVHNAAGPVGVRAVELQLKHHWQHLDYQLAH